MYIYEWLCTDKGALACAFLEHKIIGPVFFSHFIMPGLYPPPPPPPPTHTHWIESYNFAYTCTFACCRLVKDTTTGLVQWRDLRCVDVAARGQSHSRHHQEIWQPNSYTAEQTANGLTVPSSALCGFLRHHAVLRIYFVLRCEMHNI